MFAVRKHSQGLCLLCGENIAEENFLDIVRLDRWDSLEGS